MELYERFDEVKKRPFVRLELTIPETVAAQRGLALWLTTHTDKSKMTYAEKQVAVVAGRDIAHEYPAGAKIRFSDMQPVSILADIAVEYALHLRSELQGVNTNGLVEAQDLAVALTLKAHPIESIQV